MRGSLGARRRWVALSLLAGVAVLGYAVGHGSGGSGSSSVGTRAVLVDGVLLDYPASWRRASAPPPIPGLSLQHQIALVPPGKDRRAGLTVGTLANGEPGPLPSAFVAGMRALPHTDVVNLVELQAYRYSGVAVAGFDGRLTVFATPSATGGAAILACYAGARDAAFVRTCAQVVDALTRVGEAASYDLTPSPGYARSLNAALGALDRQRLLVARQARPARATSELGTLAARLARQFAAAGTSLSALEAPSAVRSAQAALLSALAGARDSYAALGEAVRARDLAAYEAARGRVQQAEARVDAALAGLSLLGYGRASS